MRFGTGPVFAYERVAAARRWHLYAGRSLLVAGLLVAMMFIAGSHVASPRMTSQDFAKIGQAYFYAMISVEMAIVMLAAPAATAGAICLDRARGNLAHMLLTDLSDSEIVLGKLGARLMPVLGLVACSWPVMAIGTLLGGIDPAALTLAFAVILAMAFLGCTMAMALSVWARKTQEVLLATYTALGLILLAYPFWFGIAHSGGVPRPPRWLLHTNPVYLAFSPYWAPGTIGWEDYAWFFGVSLGVATLLTGLAVWRMRPASRTESSRGGNHSHLGLLGRLVRRFPSPSLDANPILWREWHRSRPSPWMIILTALVIGTTTACCIAGAIAMFIDGVRPGPGGLAKYAGVYGYMVLVMFGLLMFAAVAPTALAEERQRGSLDVLLTTPMSTRSIVMAKWLGTFRFVPFIAFGPSIMAFAMASGPTDRGGTPFSGGGLSYVQLMHGMALMALTLLAHGALLTSIGLALATWISRQSRAMALSVLVYVLMSVAWPMLYFTIAARHHPGDAVPGLSPIFVAGSLADVLTIRQAMFVDFLWGATGWDVLVLVVAAGLFELTVRTFERCLGRMPEFGVPGMAGPMKRPPDHDAELIAEWETG